MPKRYTPSNETIDRVLAEIEGDNDRAAIIVGVSMLEHMLERAIASRLRPMESETDQQLMFSESGLFGSFSQKIFAGYAMRLIGPIIRRDLDLLRMIRNEAAHSMNPISFDDGAIKNRVNELTIVWSLVDEQLPRNYRDKFIRTVQMLGLGLIICEHEPEGGPASSYLHL